MIEGGKHTVKLRIPPPPCFIIKTVVTFDYVKLHIANNPKKIVTKKGLVRSFSNGSTEKKDSVTQIKTTPPRYQNHRIITDYMFNLNISFKDHNSILEKQQDLGAIHRECTC